MIDLTHDDLLHAKEKTLMLEGEAGKIEAIFNGSDKSLQKNVIAILGHPHSLHGGSMNNKVLTTLVKACREVGIASLRFNFRGVGRSEGEFDRGIGESEDVLRIVSGLSDNFPGHQFILAGFSFGAYVTYRAASQKKPLLLISVAPAVNHGDFSEFEWIPSPWHVLAAEKDEIVAKDEILAWHQSVNPCPELHMFEDSSHFFHGKLVVLKDKLKEILRLVT